LKAPVFEGQRFWLVVYPRQIQSLRHVWTHPAFKDEDGSLESSPSVIAAKEWLNNFAGKAEISYERLMRGARDYVESGEYLIDGGKWEGFDVPDEFWSHYEAVTGERVAEDDRGSFFSCSC
jgi:hypothetical protein